MTAEEPAVLGTAVIYAARGWAVLPVAAPGPLACRCGTGCGTPGKHPLTRHGVHDASDDPVQVRHWWRRWPWANVGIATGARSAIAVVDVDPHHGGQESLMAMAGAGLDLPNTLAVLTGGGGFHLYFRQPPGITIANTVGRLPGVDRALPGVDLRGDGGYVVAPPSLHVSGKRYRWRLEEAEMAILPRWLWPPTPPPIRAVGPLPARAGSPGAYGSAALAGEVAAVRRLVPGQRNDGLNRAAFALGSLVAGGELSEDVVERELLTAAMAAGLGELEARRTIRSGLRSSARVPRQAPLTGRRR